jgi:hypothetical protein
MELALQDIDLWLPVQGTTINTIPLFPTFRLFIYIMTAIVFVCSATAIYLRNMALPPFPWA